MHLNTVTRHGYLAILAILTMPMPCMLAQDIYPPLTVSTTADPAPSGSGIQFARFGGGIITKSTTSPHCNMLGDNIPPAWLADTGWNTGTTIIGPPGKDKVMAGYLASSTNRALIGAHNAALTNWAPLTISGYLLEFRIDEGLAATLLRDKSFVIGTDPSGTGLLRVGGGADIKGVVRTKEVNVTVNGWADSVFSADYRLPPLAEVAASIQTDRHLPGIPSEAEILKNGLSLGDMQRLHMTKIEELTLYSIQADARLAETERKLNDATAENAQLKARLEAIEMAIGLTSSK